MYPCGSVWLKWKKHKPWRSHPCPSEMDGSVYHIGWLTPSILSGSEKHIDMLSSAAVFTIMQTAAINLSDTTKRFILIKTIAANVTAKTYPNNVAIPAPSTPKDGINQKLKPMLDSAPIVNTTVPGHVFFTTRN